MHAWVCVHVCMCVCVCACVRVHVRVCVCVSICLLVSTCVMCRWSLPKNAGKSTPFPLLCLWPGFRLTSVHHQENGRRNRRAVVVIVMEEEIKSSGKERERQTLLNAIRRALYRHAGQRHSCGASECLLLKPIIKAWLTSLHRMMMMIMMMTMMMMMTMIMGKWKGVIVSPVLRCAALKLLFQQRTFTGKYNQQEVTESFFFFPWLQYMLIQF